MQKTQKLTWFILSSPLFVLVVSKICVELSNIYFRHELAWIPAFIGYYISIGIVGYVALKFFSINVITHSALDIRKRPGKWLLMIGVVVPALLPISVFISYIDKIPVMFIAYILLFSLINPFFEEGFWRGLLSRAPVNKTLTIFYSAALFSFSHYFLWGSWFKDMLVLVPTLVSTFIMGVAWMWFVQKTKNLGYPIISHIFVDIFNLSVAVYYGLVPIH